MKITPDLRTKISVAAYTRRRALIEMLSESVESDRFARRVLATRLIGNVLWIAEEHVHDSRASRHIASYVLAKRDGRWGFLNRTEKAGPWHATCPVELLDQVPPVNHAWRARVIARAMKKARAAARLPSNQGSLIQEASLP